MKEYILSRLIAKGNPTVETQEKIIKIIEGIRGPISITTLSKLSKTGFNETKTSIAFLHKFGIVEIISSGGTTLVEYRGKQNAEA